MDQTKNLDGLIKKLGRNLSHFKNRYKYRYDSSPTFFLKI